jgi:dipeptidyl aminopeptidase/acylaminoacyl peptidase
MKCSPILPMVALFATAITSVAPPSLAADSGGFDAAAAFGARPSISHMRLSPDGKTAVFLAPLPGMGSAAMTIDLTGDSKPHMAVVSDGKPYRLQGCNWVSNDRLVCLVYGVIESAAGILPVTRLLAVNSTGGEIKVLSTEANATTRGFYLTYGGTVIDWLPELDGKILMARPDVRANLNGARQYAMSVDRIDTRTGGAEHVEDAAGSAGEYLSDGHGQVRIAVYSIHPYLGSLTSGQFSVRYRKRDSHDWLSLAEYDTVAETGFRPIRIDADQNLVFGTKKKDGRWAIYSMSLDGNATEALVYSRDDVDVDTLLEVGRQSRVVGVEYSTDFTHTDYFDPALGMLMKALGKALPNTPQLDIVDSSLDGNTLLIHSGSDDDPGEYYFFHRDTHQLGRISPVRLELQGHPLAKEQPVSYPARDNERIPGYLTLPPGVTQGKGLPTIVMPHGGPTARDRWGFDWLAQFFAARGYAVLQPNFRGSDGYGDSWRGQHGFKEWRTSVNDVLDAGHWLVSEGIADPNKLFIVGWSYGGYAALQSAVVEPDLYKAVVAIAPLTDFASAKGEWQGWSSHHLVDQEVGTGPHIVEGSPARNAGRIKVPVLLFHGVMDRNVDIRQSRLMDEGLKKAGVKHELVTWDTLDHGLEDSAVRATMLRKSDEFLRQAMVSAP